MEVTFGVIALTGQVVDTSFKIKKVVDSFQSAPTEIKELSSKLIIVDRACAQLRADIESERRRYGTSDLSDKGGALVLKDIKSLLTKLDVIVQKLDGKRSKTASRGIYFLRKKDDLKMLNESLDEKIMLLHLLLSVETFSKNQTRDSRPSEKEDTQSKKLITKVSASTNQTARKPPAQTPAKTTRVLLDRVTQEATWVLGIQSVFNRNKITKKSKWKNGDETTTVNETSSLSIRHRSSAYAVEIMWRLAGPLSISCSLNVPHIIDSRTHKDIKWKLYRFCYGGSVKGLQEMFSQGLVTPTSLIDGATLFEWAASFPQPDMCRFILQSNSKLAADEYLLGSKAHPGRNSDQARGSPTQISEFYVDLAEMCLATEVPTIVQYRFLVSSMCHPRDMLMCFEKFQHQVFHEEWLDFIDVAWDEAVGLFTKDIGLDSQWTPTGDMYDHWFPLFGRIVQGGVDVSKRLRNTKEPKTALWHMLTVSCCPFNLDNALFYWRYILWACRVDFDEYLTHEWSLFDILWDQRWEENRTYSWPRALAQTTICGLIFPTWTRHVEPKSKASEVRQEFKGFGSHKPISAIPSIPFLHHLTEMEEEERHLTWKAFEHWDEIVYREAWPFGFAPARDSWEYHPGWHNWSDSREKAAIAEQSFNYAKELLQARFRKRERNKLHKSGYWKRYKKLRGLPGAWEEEMS